MVHLLTHFRQLGSLIAGRERRRDVGQVAIEPRSLGIVLALRVSTSAFGLVLEVRGRVGEGHGTAPSNSKLQIQLPNGTPSTADVRSCGVLGSSLFLNQ